MATTRHLYVLRHAKSSWDDPFLSDAERPLSPRGQAAAIALCQHFQDVGVALQLVLCSPARRTRETWEGIRAGVVGAPEVRFVPALYGASAQELVELLRTLPDDVGAVLLIGHNPGVTELLTQLAGDPGHVPTGTFATLRLRGSWAHLDRRTAVLEDLVRPRTLTGEDDAEQ